jgi:hypothetical protein
MYISIIFYKCATLLCALYHVQLYYSVQLNNSNLCNVPCTALLYKSASLHCAVCQVQFYYCVQICKSTVCTVMYSSTLLYNCVFLFCVISCAFVQWCTSNIFACLQRAMYSFAVLICYTACASLCCIAVHSSAILLSCTALL